MWFSQLGYPHIALKFPYKRQSPLTKKTTTYHNIEQVWEEIYELVDKWSENKFSLGRNLYFHLPLFMNPKWILDSDYNTYMREFNYITEFNIPLGRDLDSTDAFRLEIMGVIKNEINQIKNYMSEKNG